MSEPLKADNAPTARSHSHPASRPPRQLVRIEAGGVHWELAAEYRDALVGPDGLRLEEWLAAGRAQVVKTGPHRTVYRVNLPGLRFYLKHNRLSDLRAWLRELVRPAKARIEYDRALAVAACQVPTVVPLALGESPRGAGPGDSFLITRSLDGAEPMNTFVLTTLPTFPPKRQVQIKQRLARELGRLIARMHDAGIVHNDLHPGNLLLRLSEDDHPCLYLIDLHSVRLGRPLGWFASRTNLTLLNRWCVLQTGRTDRLRFWQAYCQARAVPGWWRAGGRLVDWLGAAKQKSLSTPPAFARRPLAPPTVTALARDVEEHTWLSNLRFWRSRDRRCLVSNRYYRQVRAADTAGYAVSDLDADALQPLLADPDAPFDQPGAVLLKNSRSSTVTELDVRVGGILRRCIYKRFRVTSCTDPWMALLRPPGAVRSWVFGHGLRDRCLPTPRPLAVLHRQRHGLLYESYLLMEKVPNARNLRDFVVALDSRDAAERRIALRSLIDQVAHLARRLHQCQISHRDLKATNLLVNGDGVWLIDLVGIRRHLRLSPARRMQNLTRLHASFCQDARLTRTDKLRFLRVYLQWGLLGRGGWKRWWRQIEQATQAKLARNRRFGRPVA
jgi:tRNA A-37 threonylcarbamoyl transferase component Bud32